MVLAFLSSLVWLGSAELLALGLLPLWSLIFSAGAEKILGYSRILSLFTLTWVTWLLCQYGGAPFTACTAIGVALLLLLAAHIALRLRFSSWQVFLYDQKLRGPYLSFIITFLVILFFRSCSPEIFWGEKPLDFSLFNYLIRETSLPAEHPWAAGSNMSYYYLGFFGLAILQKISLLDPAIGYNFALAFIGASLLSCFESLFLNLKLSRTASILGAILLTFGSSFNPVFLSLFQDEKSGFDLFWLTTRHFNSPAFAEYPIWSLLFADLHAHVMAMPLVVCLIGLTWAAAYQRTSLHAHSWLLTALTGFVWGLLYTVNGWDFVSSAILLAILFGFSLPFRLSLVWLKPQVYFVALLALGAAIVVLPFRLAQENMFKPYWGWVVTSEFNPIYQVALHHGGALTVILLCAIGLVLGKKLRWIGFWREFALMLLALFPLLFGAFSLFFTSEGQPWNIFSFACVISSVGFLFFLTDPTSLRLRFCCLLVLSGSVLMSLVEALYLFDRMNTIFKGYQLLWPLFGVSACMLLSDFGKLLYTRLPLYLSTWKMVFSHALHGLCFSAIAVMLVGTAINLSIMLPMKRTSNPRFTLNGSLYLEKDNADEAYLIRWLQNNVEGIAYIAEASGPSYQSFTRVTVNTGLPSLLGWEYHSRQGGVAQTDLDARKKSIEEIFHGTDPQMAYRQLENYGIDFVFIGKVEREEYPKQSLQKFADNPDLFIPIAWKGNYSLYLNAFSPFKESLLKRGSPSLSQLTN